MKFRLIIDKEKPEEIVATVHEKSALTDRIEELIEKENQTDEIIGYDHKGITILKPDDIEAFYIESGKTFAVSTDGKKYRVKSALYELEAVLPKNFQKINKSGIANMNHIVRFKTGVSGAVDAEFKSGFCDYISRRCFSDLKRRYSL